MHFNLLVLFVKIHNRFYYYFFFYHIICFFDPLWITYGLFVSFAVFVYYELGALTSRRNIDDPVPDLYVAHIPWRTVRVVPRNTTVTSTVSRTVFANWLPMPILSDRHHWDVISVPRRDDYYLLFTTSHRSRGTGS